MQTNRSSAFRSSTARSHIYSTMTCSIRPACAIALCATLAFGLELASAQTPLLLDLGVLPNCTSSTGRGLSSDGTVVVGECTLPSGAKTPFRWTAAEGMVGLGLLAGRDNGGAYGVAAGGNAIYGGCWTSTTGISRAFRWTPTGGLVDMGALGGTGDNGFFTCTPSGTLAVGVTHIASGDRAIRWSIGNGTEILPGLLGTLDAEARDISADGAVVVGTCMFSSGSTAYRWTSAGGTQSLGRLPSATYSVASGVSANSRVIAGASGGPATFSARLYRWTSERGMEDLGAIPGHSTSPYDGTINADGSAIGGMALLPSPYVFRAILWTRATGLELLENYLTRYGVDVRGWQFSWVSGISDDASVLSGVGLHNGLSRAFIVTGLPSVRERCLADMDNGTGTGTPDGGVTIDDLLYYIAIYGEGLSAADVDNGTGTGTPDGGVTIDDLLFFLARYEAGC